MVRRGVAVLALFGFIALGTAAVKTATARAYSPPPDRVTVHEWGTFTSIAGIDGRAIEWLPLGGPSDLPCFVEHFHNNQILKVIPTEDIAPVDYETARSKLWGKVRMETPVLYLYGPAGTKVDVAVQFPRGLITEYYPRGVTAQPAVTATSLHSPAFFSAISWNHVTLAPTQVHDFPVDAGQSHYYAARMTDASPLAVGPQHEKFLFYRGVANFDVPLSAAATAAGVAIRNLGTDAIPNVVLFERHGATLSYRIGGPLQGDMTLSPPTGASASEALRADLEQMLIKGGLYPKEAAAMLETWRDSWFEEGTRVFYIVPTAAVDRVLPLTVTPLPASTTRVFVGRMEVVTPLVQQTVESAIANNDRGVLQAYARFLGPITDRILAATPDRAAKDRIRAAASAAYASYLKRSAVCE